MPSGSKKRKAAKKKKEKDASNNSATHSHGDDNLKVHDEKESDGGEAISPASQDHHNHQHPFTEGEEEMEMEMEKREDTSPVRSMVTENEPIVGVNSNGESTHKVAMKDNSVIQIEWELKPEDDTDSKNGSIDYVESVKESHGGRMSHDDGSSSGGGSSSSSSSDDESHVVEKNIVVIEYGEPKEDGPTSVAESATFADAVKTAGLPEVTQVTDGVPVMDAYNLAVDKPEEDAYDPAAANAPSVNLVKPSDLPEVTQVTDGVPVIETYSLVVGKSTEEAYNSVVETIPLVGSENVSKEVVHVNDSSSVENAICSNVCELGLKENGKNETLGVSPIVMDKGSQSEEDKVSSTAFENSAVTSVDACFAAQEDEDKLLPSSSVPAVDTSNGADLVKDSVITECCDSQPLVASVPRPVRTPFWKSCCGLFEVFTT